MSEHEISARSAAVYVLFYNGLTVLDELIESVLVGKTRLTYVRRGVGKPVGMLFGIFLIRQNSSEGVSVDDIIFVYVHKAESAGIGRTVPQRLITYGTALYIGDFGLVEVIKFDRGRIIQRNFVVTEKLVTDLFGKKVVNAVKRSMRVRAGYKHRLILAYDFITAYAEFRLVESRAAILSHRSVSERNYS